MALTRITAMLLAIVWASLAWSQGNPIQPVTTPDARNLAPGWWKFIEEAGPELRQRTEALIAAAAADVQANQDLNGQSDEINRQFLDRLRINLRALPALIDESVAAAEEVPQTADQYSLEEYLGIERNLRQAHREAEELTYSIRRNENSIRAAQRRIDTLMATYLALNVADPSRVRGGLQIMALRSELAITQQQLRMRNETRDGINQRVSQLTALLEQVAGLLVATADDAARIDTQLDTLQAKLESVQLELRERQSRALGTQGITSEERSRSAWRDLRVMEFAANEHAIELEISNNKLKQSWYQLSLAQDTDEVHLPAAQQQLESAEGLLARVRRDLDEWQQQSERELVTLRLENQDGSAELKSMNQSRLEAANQVLTNVANARGLAKDNDFLVQLLRQRVAAEQGLFGSGISAVWLWLNEAWVKADAWGGVSLFKMGETPVTAFGLARVALILFAAIWISRLFRHALDRLSSRKEGTQSAFYTVGRLAHYVIIALGIVIGLSSIGLSFSNLAIVAGALGVGIGFGLQSIVNNFVSGLILLFERSLKVGDYVQLESGVGGLVKEINVRSTLINTNDNLDILVPNSEFVSGRLTNWTLKEESRRMHIPFGVAYGSDKDKVKSSVLEGIKDVPYSVTDNPSKPIEVWLIGFGDSSLDFELVLWVKQASVRNPSRVHAAYTWAIETALIKNGIEIPFPQRDLHLRSGFQSTQNEPQTEKTPEEQSGI